MSRPAYAASRRTAPPQFAQALPLALLLSGTLWAVAFTMVVKLSLG